MNGSLNLSRALGDMDFKQSKDLPAAEQMITAMPDVRTLQLHPGDEFLILACDGIWEMLTNQEVTVFYFRASRKSPVQRGLVLPEDALLRLIWTVLQIDVPGSLSEVEERPV